MEIIVYRKYPGAECVIGEMLIDGKFFCYTMEDVEREGPKVPGKTAIPRGRYRVILDVSKRFKRIMPHILDVPGFDGIRIHKGNTAVDTEGCLLVGKSMEGERIFSCQAAFDEFYAILEKGRREYCWIEIKGAKNGDVA